MNYGDVANVLCRFNAVLQDLAGSNAMDDVHRQLY